MRKPIFAFLVSLLFVHGASAQSRTYGLIAYSPALALGETDSFVSDFGWFGGTLEGGWITSDTTAIGISGRYHYFYEKRENALYTGDRNEIAVYGTQFRSLTAVPVQAKVTYVVPAGASSNPMSRAFGALGVGGLYQNQQLEIGSFLFSKIGWVFSLSPEIGVILRRELATAYAFSVRYDHGFGTDDLPTVQILSFNFALVQSF
jgi:hypothetical protein